METLELSPLKDKKLVVLAIEKEYNEPFWLLEPLHNQPLKLLNRASIAFFTFLEKVIQKVGLDFATEELGLRSLEEFNESCVTKLFQRKKIPFYPVDIDESARTYLAHLVDEKKQLRDVVLQALAKLPAKKEKNNRLSMEKEYLVAYGQYLQDELEEQEKEVAFPIRESWIVMKILDKARKSNSKKRDITCLHISSPEHVNGIIALLDSLDVTVETIKPSKEVVLPTTASSNLREMGDLLESMQIRVRPIIKKASEELPYLLFFLDTDRIASPFDVCMAYDAGYDAVIPYENVNAKDAKKIVEDAIFSRGPKGVKRTCVFIGGKDIEKAREISNVVKNAMFPPLEVSVIIDPNGAYTTAAAVVAKMEEAIVLHKLGSLSNKICAVFGTGAVGRIIAVLLTKLGCDVTITSLNPNRENGDEYAAEVAEHLHTRYGAEVQGYFAPTPERKLKLLKKAEVIFCAGTRGVRVIDKEMLKHLRLLKVMADINAIPPLGIEGIKLADDMRELLSGIYGIGALTVGRLKHEVEMELLKEVRRMRKGVYTYNFALELARKLLRKEIRPEALEITLRYPTKTEVT